MFNNSSQSCQVSSHKVLNNYWKVIISDDDDDEIVHQVTKLVLKYFECEHKKLEFISAFTIDETLFAKEKTGLIVNFEVRIQELV